MKVLIISHNPLSTFQNMGKTMCSLFSSFKKDEICQLYLYPSIPDVDKCSSYYRVTDSDIIKSGPFSGIRGKIIVPVVERHEIIDDTVDSKMYKSKLKYSDIVLLLRDALWISKVRISKDVESWIAKENPTHIFLVPGKFIFTYKLALKISKQYNLPIVTYVCDDYYHLDYTKNFILRIRGRLLKNTILKTLKASKNLVAICNETAELYEKEFGVPTEVIMTGSNLKISDKSITKKNISSLSFFGNISINRNIALSEMGKALDKINEKIGTDYALNIYTSQVGMGYLTPFDGVKSINLMDFVSGEDFLKAFYSSEALVHVEAFDEGSMEETKYSISTKIADSLASGIPLFAYGPKDVASISHLIRNKCAMVVSNNDELIGKLELFMSDFEARNNYATEALKVSRKFHNSKMTSDKLYNVLYSTTRK